MDLRTVLSRPEGDFVSAVSGYPFLGAKISKRCSQRYDHFVSVETEREHRGDRIAGQSPTDRRMPIRLARRALLSYSEQADQRPQRAGAPETP